MKGHDIRGIMDCSTASELCLVTIGHVAPLGGILVFSNHTVSLDMQGTTVFLAPLGHV